ncbi:hypothetical protein IBE27_09135, partial [Francisella tularensis subsp. novicida]|nr:hypothetical protein [Francisella tularensis subsp. novicida]MBK2339871.1 hypothetical protein [Francisella tularensis subsp. novicida]
QTTTDPSYQVTIPSYDVDNPNLKVKVKVTDSANKTAESKESSIGIEVDATIAGPTNASISGANEAKEGTQVALTASATVANGRKIKGYEWRVDGGAAQTTTDASYEFKARSFDANKPNSVISLVVIDSANNRSQAVTKNVKITADASIKPGKPTLQAPDKVKEGDTFTLSASAQANGGRTIKAYEWSVDGQVIAGATGSSLQRTAPAFSSSKPSYNYSVVAIDSADQRSVATSANISIEQKSSTELLWTVNLAGQTVSDIVRYLNVSAYFIHRGNNASFAAEGNQIRVTCKNGYTVTPKYPGQKKELVAATMYGSYMEDMPKWTDVHLASWFSSQGIDNNGKDIRSVIGSNLAYLWSYGCYPPL